MNTGVAEEVSALGVGRVPPARAEDPDHELLTRWQAGDGDAFAALVRRHQGRVFGLLVRMLGDRHEAEDVAQEAFLNVYRHGRRFRRDARFSTYLYRVAANAALNRRRSLGRLRQRHERLAGQQSAGQALPASPRSPDEAAQGRQVEASVQAALGSLPPLLRAPVVLYDIEGMPYAEIARVLRIAEGTVKSRIHRGRQALREALRPLVRQEESA